MWRQGEAEMQNGLFPHPRVVDKNSVGISQPQPNTMPPRWVFLCQEFKFPLLLAVKTSGDWVSGRNFWIPKQFLLKDHTQTYSDSLPLSFGAGVSTWKALVIYREKLKCLASREDLGDSFLPDRTAGRRSMFLFWTWNQKSQHLCCLSLTWPISRDRDWVIMSALFRWPAISQGFVP